MTYFALLTLDGDVVQVFDDFADAAAELAHRDDEHYIEEISKEEYTDFEEEFDFQFFG